jgi:hypothetical protein
MNFLLASTVMVVAGVSLLIAFTFRTWSRAYRADFKDMRERMIEYEKRIVALEKKMSDTQIMLENVRGKVEARGNQGETL